MKTIPKDVMRSDYDEMVKSFVRKGDKIISSQRTGHFRDFTILMGSPMRKYSMKKGDTLTTMLACRFDVR